MSTHRDIRRIHAGCYIHEGGSRLWERHLRGPHAPTEAGTWRRYHLVSPPFPPAPPPPVGLFLRFVQRKPLCFAGARWGWKGGGGKGKGEEAGVLCCKPPGPSSSLAISCRPSKVGGTRSNSGYLRRQRSVPGRVGCQCPNTTGHLCPPTCAAFSCLRRGTRAAHRRIRSSRRAIWEGPMPPHDEASQPSVARRWRRVTLPGSSST